MPADQAQFDPVRFSQTGEFISQFVVGVLGALIVTSEYATGSIRTTLATVPRRTTVLAAKGLVVATVIFVVTEVTAFASFFVGQAVLSAHGGKTLPAGSTIHRPGEERRRSRWSASPNAGRSPRRLPVRRLPHSC